MAARPFWVSTSFFLVQPVVILDGFNCLVAFALKGPDALPQNTFCFTKSVSPELQLLLKTPSKLGPSFKNGLLVFLLLNSEYFYIFWVQMF